MEFQIVGAVRYYSPVNRQWCRLLQLYIAPELAIFGDVHHDPWNNFRLYGTVSLLVLTLIVAVGVKFVQMFAPISLACVIISFLSIVIGACLATAESTNIW